MSNSNNIVLPFELNVGNIITDSVGQAAKDEFEQAMRNFQFFTNKAISFSALANNDGIDSPSDKSSDESETDNEAHLLPGTTQKDIVKDKSNQRVGQDLKPLDKARRDGNTQTKTNANGRHNKAATQTTHTKTSAKITEGKANTETAHTKPARNTQAKSTHPKATTDSTQAKTAAQITHKKATTDFTQSGAPAAVSDPKKAHSKITHNGTQVKPSTNRSQPKMTIDSTQAESGSIITRSKSTTDNPHGKVTTDSAHTALPKANTNNTQAEAPTVNKKRKLVSPEKGHKSATITKKGRSTQPSNSANVNKNANISNTGSGAIEANVQRSNFDIATFTNTVTDDTKKSSIKATEFNAQPSNPTSVTCTNTTNNTNNADIQKSNAVENKIELPIPYFEGSPDYLDKKHPSFKRIMLYEADYVNQFIDSIEEYFKVTKMNINQHWHQILKDCFKNKGFANSMALKDLWQKDQPWDFAKLFLKNMFGYGSLDVEDAVLKTIFCKQGKNQTFKNYFHLYCIAVKGFPHLKNFHAFTHSLTLDAMIRKFISGTRGKMSKSLYHMLEMLLEKKRSAGITLLTEEDCLIMSNLTYVPASWVEFEESVIEFMPALLVIESDALNEKKRKIRAKEKSKQMENRRQQRARKESSKQETRIAARCLDRSIIQ